MTDIAVAHATTLFISVYPWAAGFGTKYANPATLPASHGYGVAFSPDGATLAVAHATTPFVSVYPWSAGFGTKYANPATLPTGTGYGVAFSPAAATEILWQFDVFSTPVLTEAEMIPY